MRPHILNEAISVCENQKFAPKGYNVGLLITLGLVHFHSFS